MAGADSSRPPTSPRRRRRRATALVAGTIAAVALLATAGTGVAAPGADDRYTVTVGSPVPTGNATDTPADPYIDKDGRFYFQQAAALYGANDKRNWEFFSGRDFDDATKVDEISIPDTTAMCNESPTGRKATPAPDTSHYSQPNYCDLVGTWVDPDTGAWHGLVHNEFTPKPFGDGLHYDAIDYAVSTDQGRSWQITGHAITSPYSTERGDTAAFPGDTYHYGDGDPRLFADPASGYFYAYYGSRIVDKGGSWKAFHSHVARAPMSEKMAPGSWRKYYDGTWSEPGQGGKESNLVPVGQSPTGYTPPEKEYEPTNPGTTEEQIAASTVPPTSPLFIMDITYNAHLGLYIGQPQAVDQSGNAPQQIYATEDLANPKWRLIGDTGAYTTASWYRWFVDSANRTSSTVVGKDFRMYCYIACSAVPGQNPPAGEKPPRRSAEYVNATVDGPRAPERFRPDATYTIANADGLALARQGTEGATAAARTGAAGGQWSVLANGDGSYRIADPASGRLLGVGPIEPASRAWGTVPTVEPAGPQGPTVGQQWFIIDSGDGSSRLLNRYSELALGITGTEGRGAETTPVRYWDALAGAGPGAGRTAAQQTLRITPAGG